MPANTSEALLAVSANAALQVKSGVGQIERARVLSGI